MTDNIRAGIVGAGHIGWKRAEAIKTTKKGKLVAVADVNFESARKLAAAYGSEAYDNWRKLVARPDINVVVVSTTNKLVVPISIEAMKCGKHVLCEKPLGRNAKEALRALKAIRKYRRIMKVGFNHRFQAAVGLAKKIFDEGKIGKPMFIRSRYGYGGRLGMEKEWRFNRRISGGGELLDQGVHIIDLARWFIGEPERVFGLTRTKFWKTRLDDNAFVLMENKNATVQFHVSSTQWKNLFSFEIFGTHGYLEINGKGGSYGEETLTWGRRKPEFGVPDLKVFKFRGDVSWVNEWRNFIGAIAGKAKIIGGAEDGLRANQVVEAIYKSSKIGKRVAFKW